LEKVEKSLKDEVIAVLVNGVQGPDRHLNLKITIQLSSVDNVGLQNLIKLAEGGFPVRPLFEWKEACEKGTILLQCLLSDAGQITALWPDGLKNPDSGKALNFLMDFGSPKEKTGIILQRM